jgi:hypothetical protein
MSDKITYPDLPGWKGSKPSGREAAFAIAPELKGRQQEVFEAFAKRGPTGCTCDDLQEELGLPTYCIRPRASELEAKGRLFPVGKAKGGMGHKVTLYSVHKPEPVAEAA